MGVCESTAQAATGEGEEEVAEGEEEVDFEIDSEYPYISEQHKMMLCVNMEPSMKVGKVRPPTQPPSRLIARVSRSARSAGTPLSRRSG